ncbi:MAG: recombinase family protein [Hyphomicrobiaceae bacterium]|nr:recombinase family protein [Hyphomicrobiaceae bacterium]
MSFQLEPSHNVTDAVIYCRVSSKAQTKRGDGLNSQETRCRQYASFKGYNVKTVFTDDLTGQRADRPGVQAMLAYLRSDRRNPHVVIIDDLSRFARDVRVHFDLRAAIGEAGGILKSPTIEFGEDSDSLLVENMLASVSQHQRQKNAEQTINRMRARTMNGYWCFAAPIGYRYERTSGHGNMLVRDEPYASILQEALEGFASGRFDSQVEVKRFLESQPDFPKDLPGNELRNQRVNDLLTRVTYAGYIEVPKWDISLRQGKHEGLIDLATFQKIQDRLKGGAKVPARADINADFPLRGFVVCGDCHKPLTACWSKSKTGKQHPYYLCHNRSCESHRKSIRRNQIEGDFTAMLHTLTPSKELFSLVKVMFKDAWNMRLEQATTMKATLEADIVKVERQIGQAVDRIMNSESDVAIAAYEQRIAELEKRKLVASEKLAKGTAPKRTFEEMFELACGFLANPRKLWDSGQIHLRKTVLRLGFTERMAYTRN